MSDIFLRPGSNLLSCTMYSAVQINMIKGCVSTFLVHPTFDHIYSRSRVQCKFSSTLRAAFFCAARCGDLVLTAAVAAEHGGPAPAADAVAAVAALAVLPPCCCSSDSALRTGRRTWFGMSWIDGF